MVRTQHLSVTLAALLALGTVAVSPVTAQTAPPNALNFQGRLATPSGNPVPDGTYSVRFRFYDAATAGNVVYEQTLASVAVKNGTFAVAIDGFTADKFNGNTWLGIKVGNDTELTPRTQIVSVPYALKSTLALSVPDGSITNAKIAAGTLTADRFTSGTFNTTAWLLGGNSGTDGTQFLGTTDNQPLVLKVKNHRAMRYQYGESTASQRSINVLGGSELNTITEGVIGATIAGGGWDSFTGTDYPNSVTGDFGTIGGGAGNTAGSANSTIAGGEFNTASGQDSTLGGGNSNTASGYLSTVAGGFLNTASGSYSAVAGGEYNIAGDHAAVGGGYANLAYGTYSTVAGGYANTASGNSSFAAGSRARAFHDGAFVWSDTSTGIFDSTAPSQFLLRAAGGVGINTNTPNSPLSFSDALGDKISLWGQSGNHYGFGIASGTLRIHARDAGNSIDFGYGNYSNFALAARIYCNGDFLAVGDEYAAHFYQRSDARYKNNVQTLPNALDMILGLRGVSFEWNKEKGAGHDIGFLAQEVEQVLPQVVHTDANGYKSVAYANVVPVTVEAIKTLNARSVIQQKQIDALAAVQQENAALKAKNAELEAKLTQLAEAVAQLKAQRK